MDPKFVAFTGHRPDKLGGYRLVNPVRDVLKERLGRYLEAYRRSVCPAVQCISGMALGFDQWAVEVCVSLEVPFTAAIPFVGQEDFWSREAAERYRELLSKACKVVLVSPGEYEFWKPLRRNEWMVEHCDVLVGAWDGSSTGGTAHCVRYAKKCAKPFRNLYLTGT